MKMKLLAVELYFLDIQADSPYTYKIIVIDNITYLYNLVTNRVVYFDKESFNYVGRSMNNYPIGWNLKLYPNSINEDEQEDVILVHDSFVKLYLERKIDNSKDAIAFLDSYYKEQV